ERENLALANLSKSIADRPAAAASLKLATAALEAARQKAANESHDVAGALRIAAQSIDQEGVAWAEYYQKLAEGARGEAAAPAPVTAAPKPSVTPSPLSRYLGAWTYPAGGLYHGPQPEFV